MNEMEMKIAKQIEEYQQFQQIAKEAKDAADVLKASLMEAVGTAGTLVAGHYALMVKKSIVKEHIVAEYIRTQLVVKAV